MAANKVLLVDDDPGIIEVLKLYFEKEGFTLRKRVIRYPHACRVIKQ